MGPSFGYHWRRLERAASQRGTIMGGPSRTSPSDPEWTLGATRASREGASSDYNNQYVAVGSVGDSVTAWEGVVGGDGGWPAPPATTPTPAWSRPGGGWHGGSTARHLPTVTNTTVTTATTPTPPTTTDLASSLYTSSSPTASSPVNSTASVPDHKPYLQEEEYQWLEYNSTGPLAATRANTTSLGVTTTSEPWLTSHVGRHLNVTDAGGGTSTAFPGYLNLEDLGLEIGDYPDALSMFGNLTDCAPPWGVNGTLGCWGAAGGSMANASNGSLGGIGEEGAAGGPRYWALLLLFFPVLTVVGNLLVVTSVYRERALRTVTNYFIVSLAIADIAVGLLVMPLAIYTEVNSGAWRLGDVLCDAWVALDVMGCTSSILNLTAISVDRFIAVTQPIRYAKHKHSRRVHLMLGLTWIVAIAISSPIALGMNYTEARSLTPELCVFYNSEFLICSSMGSFYIPCIIMIVLYWRIFRAIHLRAKKQAMKMTKHLVNDRNLKNVIENKAQVQAPEPAQANSHKRKCPVHGSPPTPPGGRGRHETTSFTNVVTTTDTGDDDTHGAEVIKSPLSDDTDHVIPNDKSTEFMLSPQSEDSHCEYREDSGYSAPVAVVVETQFSAMTSPTSPKNLLSPPPRKAVLGFRNHAAKLNLLKKESKESPRKSVTKFNFHLRHSKKKKQNFANRRERKATKTLAIVLGVFLFCWMPFFTVNVMTAICIRMDTMHKPECNLDPNLMSFFVWLGYINSFLNPVIYTIFNMEFRKAFKNIIVDPCHRKR